ncbi:MAG: oxidative damage protection protein [Chloroflexi bacterium]|nr:oxidative damage protection protein [Chloroflexota bacterium]MCI0580280.1 oxidative damage protection protein [Chloroflexota bacterium]MCI0643691.1 oxidative damage protection protein [Chloroflexota bacterium]MCI0729075.1 oxidative damage protection protein [Chloroflexota bacterium]
MARFEKTITLVNCLKVGQELPALERPPFPGELGQRIYENISKLAWSMWQQQSTILINHYGLNMADPQAQEFLFEQMEEFFFGQGGQMPEDWIPQGAARKGGPGAPRK